MAVKTYTMEEASKVRPGVLTLMNVSVKEAGRSLSSLYSEKRRALLEPFAEMVREGQLSASPISSNKMKEFLRELRKTTGLDLISETGQTQLYNAFAGELTNVLAVARADKRYEEAWKRLITTLEVSTMSIGQQLGREVRVATAYSWHSNIFPELLFSPLTVTDIWERFSREKRSYTLHGVLSMTAEVRKVLSDLFFGIMARIPLLTESLPEGRNLKTEVFEQATATDLMTLEGVALNGSLLSANGSISAVAVKKVKAKTGLSDFNFPADGMWPLDRVELLCLTYFTLLGTKKDKSPIDIKQLALFAVEEMPRMIIGPMFSSFLPRLQGFTKTWTANSYASRITGAVKHILTLSMRCWLGLENFRMQLLCSEIEGNHNFIYLNLFSFQDREKAKLQRKADKEKGIEQPREIEWFEEIGFKFAVHWIKYLCALGIVEIAYDPDAKETENDPMEGMRYVRLTPLGLYAFRMETDYTPKAPEGSLDIDFDARNRILTIDANSPFQMFLDRITKRISPTRFHISVESLLKGCTNADQLTQRIDNLRTIIDPKKEPALQAIIDEAKRHTYCAAREGGYSLLRLRPDLPGLREAILTNKELREMTILAGPTLALVKTHKLDRFNAICAAYGFLMD